MVRGMSDPRLPLAIELLGKDLGPRLLAAEKTGEIRVTAEEMCRLIELTDGQPCRLRLRSTVRVVRVREASAETIQIDVTV